MALCALTWNKVKRIYPLNFAFQVYTSWYVCECMLPVNSSHQERQAFWGAFIEGRRVYPGAGMDGRDSNEKQDKTSETRHVESFGEHSAVNYWDVVGQ